jgi:hypothetical protein
MGVLSYWGAVDIVDLHIYRHHGQTVLDTHQMQYRRDPFTFGEFGALRADFANDIVRASYAVRDVQREMCAFDANGHLLWTWDTDETLASQELFFRGNEQGGAINGQLAAIVRPDPCQ